MAHSIGLTLLLDATLKLIDARAHTECDLQHVHAHLMSSIEYEAGCSAAGVYDLLVDRRDALAKEKK